MNSKNQIVKGLVRYARSEVLTKVTDKPTKIALSVVISAMESNHHIVDGILDNPIVSSVLQEKDGMYDIESAELLIVQAMEEYGDLPVKLPPIKFISPDSKEMTFSPSDVHSLKEYIVNE